MSPNVPRQDLKNSRPRSLFTTVAITILILLGLYVLLMYMMDDDSDPDRPPIIISSGSVLVKTAGDWKNEGGNGFRNDFKGKSVKSFTASTGGSACSVSGKTIVVTYGSNEIVFSRKFKWSKAEYEAFAQFPSGATVSNGAAGELLVTTTDALVSFKNEKGTSCNVVAGRVEIAQLH